MQRSKWLSWIILSICALYLSGCYINNLDKATDGPSGNDAKPTASDLSGPAVNFAGHWEGPCVALVGDAERTDCTATLDVSQPLNDLNVSGESTITISLSYNIGTTQYPAIQMPPYTISGNSLTEITGDKVGQIGNGGLRFRSDKFVLFSARVLAKDRSEKFAQRISIGTMRLPGVNLDSNNLSSSCVNDNCFVAVLTKH